MARIPDEELEKLKRDISLRYLVEAHGVVLKERGPDFVGLCPFHQEDTPSFVVSVDKNLFHCFGCGAAGSTVDWVMKTGNISFRRAVEILRKSNGAPQPVANKALPPVVALDASDQQLLDDVVGYYHSTLKESPEALAYLEKRCISTSAIDKFKIGFGNRTLGYRLPARTTAAGDELKNRLQKIGILRESGHEMMAGSVTIPILDEDGHVKGLYGRKVGQQLRPGTPLHLYLPGPHRGVFNIQALKGDGQILLCESLLDALTFWSAGFCDVTTSYGVEGFTDELLSALKAGGRRRVLIAYDRDDAGDAAAEKLSALLVTEGFETLRIKFPMGMDANEYAQKHSPVDKMLGLLVGGAHWMGRGAAVEAPVSVETVAVEKPAKPVAVERPAEPVATLPRSSTLVEMKVELDEHTFSFGGRTYRVRGLSKNTSTMVLKVNVHVRGGTGFYVDTFDLMASKARGHFIHAASIEMSINEETIKRDVGDLLDQLEALRLLRVQEAKNSADKVPPMTTEERDAAIKFLKDPGLLKRIVDDLTKVGVVGEEINKLTGYIAAISRKLKKPLAIVVQSLSGAGKSQLTDAIISLCPDEEVVKYSAMTGQALYYMEDLRHKLLSVAEEQGAEKASYPLKLLQSEGRLCIASTGKDPHSGKHETKDYKVEGPVAIFQTTTSAEGDEELYNRCLMLSVDESRAQTEAIHDAQRRRMTAAGLYAVGETEGTKRLHKNAQRLLRPLSVKNPFAEELRFPSHLMRTRRDFPKYLALIEAVTLLFQYQRDVRELVDSVGEVTEMVTATLDDVALANKLMSELLGSTLDDLSPQPRKLLTIIEQMVSEICARDACQREEVRLTQRDIRAYTGWGATQLKMHLQSLVEREYLVIHRASSGQRYLYELLYDGAGKDGSKILCGLTDVDGLRAKYAGNRAGAGRPLVGPWPVGGRADVNEESERPDAEKEDLDPVKKKTA